MVKPSTMLLVLIILSVLVGLTIYIINTPITITIIHEVNIPDNFEADLNIKSDIEILDFTEQKEVIEWLE